MLKAVCVEAGMIALRRGAVEIHHEDYMEGKETSLFFNFDKIVNLLCVSSLLTGVQEVQAKKKMSLQYYA
jgi:26S proteasome regulatory subunit T5